MNIENKKWRQCSRCILDSSDDASITFNEEGVCSICTQYDKSIAENYFGGEADQHHFKNLIAEIKAHGKNQEFDVLIGLSGGVDSTYVAYLCAEQKLRALVVHLDNGWNSETAVANIKNILTATGFDLYTYVIDWREFKDLQRSYFKANVVDIEVLTDHAISSIMIREAVRHKIKYVFTGSSIVTEAFLPHSWRFNKMDSYNIKAIQKEFGTQKIKSFPLMNYFSRRLILKLYGIRQTDILNFIHYNKAEAKQKITEAFGWKDYGGKHFESVFTRFYQAYILPKKFGIDKRKSHYSTLICAGQLTKPQALEMMKAPLYPSTEMEMADRNYVIKKLGFTETEFKNYMQAPPVLHTHYRSVENLIQKLVQIKRKFFPKP